MKKSKFTGSQIILKRAEDSVPVTDLCREHGMWAMRRFMHGAASMAAWMHQ